MNGTIRNIVAGVADPDGPDPVVGYALALARRVGATLHLVHAYPPPESAMSLGIAAADVVAGLPPVPLWNIPEEMQAVEEAVSRRVRQQLGAEAASASVQVHVAAGAPQHALASVAERVGADLVAVGATHHGGLLGSTTDRTLREVPVPTLVLRGGLRAGGARVLLTTDLSEISRAASATGLGLARALFGGEGFACRCLYVAAGTRGEIPAIDDAEMTRAARAELDGFLASLPVGGAVLEPVVRMGEAEEEIVAEAAAWRADLVVLGTHGRKGLSHLLMGSVAESVVRHVASDALVIRTPADTGG